MNSIEFAKMCRPYNLKYREIFGYVPCKDNFLCSQEEYFEALKAATESKKELFKYLKTKENRYDANRRY